MESEEEDLPGLIIDESYRSSQSSEDEDAEKARGREGQEKEEAAKSASDNDKGRREEGEKAVVSDVASRVFLEAASDSGADAGPVPDTSPTSELGSAAAAEAVVPEFQCSNSNESVTNSKNSDIRQQDFQILRKHESGKDKISPFVSSELDEFLTNLHKDRPNDAGDNGVSRRVSANRSRSASAEGKGGYSLKMRPPSPETFQARPTKESTTNEASVTYISSTVSSIAAHSVSSAVSSSSSATLASSSSSSHTRSSSTLDPARKRHANLPAVIQKYMRMSKKIAIDDDDSPTSTNESPSVIDAAVEPPRQLESRSSTKRDDKPKAARNRGRRTAITTLTTTTTTTKKKKNSSVKASASMNTLIDLESSRTPLPSTRSTPSPIPIEIEEEGGCARTNSLFPVTKSSSSSSSGSLKTSSSSEKLKTQRSPARSFAFKSLLNSHDLGAHGDLVFVRRPIVGTISTTTTTTANTTTAKLIHIHADEVGWKVEKQNIVGTVMRVHRQLQSLQTSIAFQQRSWNVDVKLYDSTKDIPCRVKFPLRTLPRSLDDVGNDESGNDDDEDVDVDVIFVRVSFMDSLVAAAEEVVDEVSEKRMSEVREPLPAPTSEVVSETPWKRKSGEDLEGKTTMEAGIAIIETRSLAREPEMDGRSDGVAVANGDASNKEACSRWCRRRSIATQVVTLRHANAGAVFKGGQRYALQTLGIHPCDPIAEVEEIMTKKRNNGSTESLTDRVVQVACNLELVNCEKAETLEKLVSLMGTTADPIPTNLPPPPPPTPVVPDVATPPQFPSPILQQQQEPPPPQLSSPSLRPTIQSPNEPQTVLPKRSSPEILLVNTTDDQEKVTPTINPNSIRPHVVADLSTSTFPNSAQNSNLRNMLANNPGSTVLPVRILPQGLVKLPPGAKVIYNSAVPSGTSVRMRNPPPNAQFVYNSSIPEINTPSPCVVNAVGSLRTVNTSEPTAKMSPAVRPTVPVPLLFPQQGKKILYLPPSSTAASQTRPMTAVRQVLNPSLVATLLQQPPRPVQQPHPSPPTLRHFSSTVTTTLNQRGGNSLLPPPLRQQLIRLPSSTSQQLNFLTSPSNVPKSSQSQLKPMQILRLPNGVSLQMAASATATPPIQSPSTIRPVNPSALPILKMVNTPTTSMTSLSNSDSPASAPTPFTTSTSSISVAPASMAVTVAPTTTAATAAPAEPAQIPGEVATTPSKSPVIVAPLRPSSTLASPPVPISLVANGSLSVLPASNGVSPKGFSQPTLEAVGSLTAVSNSFSAARSPTNSSSSSSSAVVGPGLRIESVVGGLARKSINNAASPASEGVSIGDVANESPTSLAEPEMHPMTFSGAKDDPVIL